MVLGEIAPLRGKVSLIMSSGEKYDGAFINHSFPFAAFGTTNKTVVYLQVEQITAVIQQEG